MLIRFVKLLAVPVLSALVAACSTEERPLPILEFTVEPVVTQIATMPQAYELILSTSLFTTITATLDDGQGHAYNIVSNSQARDHNLTVLGMRPNRTYSMTITARTLDDITLDSAQALQMITPPLPADFPVITLLTADPTRMAPGYTLMDTGRKDGSTAYIIIVDNAAEVVWYFKTDSLSETERIISGNFLSIDEGESGAIASGVSCWDDSG